MNSISIQHYRQHELRLQESLVAEWRIREFRHFPYLYDGNPSDELKYSRHWCNTPQASLVLAQSSDRVVGICTGNPLNADQSLFANIGIDPQGVYYIGEVIVDESMRGQKIAPLMLATMEDYAHRSGFSHTAFVSVNRADDHPLRPQGYQPPDFIWKRLGYRPSGLQTTFRWRTWLFDGTSQDCDNTLSYWIKNIGR